MTEREYAAHAGLSRGAIQKAKASGRLVLHADGSIDAAGSDAKVEPSCAGSVDETTPTRRQAHIMETPANTCRTLVLGGGNALGAYHLGVCEELLEPLSPERIIGASIGAVTAAILVGNAPELRLDRLRAFWRQAAQPGPPPGWSWEEARARESVYAGISALLGGRPGLFHGGMTRLWPPLVPGVHARALNDHAPLARTLAQLVDFDRLNGAETEVQLVTLDMESGDEVWFDNRAGRIEPEHLLAATAFPPLYPPVEIGGRLLCDAGLANNVPLDRAFALGKPRPLLCISVDLFSPDHGRPDGLNGTIARAQDLTFASQTRRTVSAVARERALLHQLEASTPPAVLARLAFRAPGHQRALKALDFSRASIDERVACGREDAAMLLSRLDGCRWNEPFEDIAVESAGPRIAAREQAADTWRG